MTAPDDPTADVRRFDPTERVARYLHNRALSFEHDAVHLERPAAPGETKRPTDAAVRAQAARIVAAELRGAAEDLVRGPM